MTGLSYSTLVVKELLGFLSQVLFGSSASLLLPQWCE
jgi:hypothetical protein